jgi:hypothetical protein
MAYHPFGKRLRYPSEPDWHKRGDAPTTGLTALPTMHLPAKAWPLPDPLAAFPRRTATGFSYFGFVASLLNDSMQLCTECTLNKGPLI